MSVNVSKTKCIIFKLKGTKVVVEQNKGVVYDDNEIGLPKDKTRIIPPIRIHNESVDQGNCTYKLLGLYLDEHLSFVHHCEHIRAKSAQSNFIINRAKHLNP